MWAQMLKLQWYRAPERVRLCTALVGVCGTGQITISLLTAVQGAPLSSQPEKAASQMIPRSEAADMHFTSPRKMQRLDNMDLALKVKRLSAHAVLPERGSAGAAGYDLSSSEDTVIPARGKALVKTDLSIICPPRTYARVAPRSGLAVKYFIDTGAGVIDEDYRGEVKVLLFNHSDTDFKVQRGDRIAQLILERIVTPEVVEVQELDSTERGAGGFGSTGIAQKQ